VENDWETSNVDNLVLPDECEDLEILQIRWLMASNEASGGGNVLGNGKSKIDEILVRGELINGVPETELFHSIVSNVGKNGAIRIHSNETVHSILITTLDGKYWSYSSPITGIEEIELPVSFCGRLIVCTLRYGVNRKRISGKLFIP
jgi:hypothetical protein